MCAQLRGSSPEIRRLGKGCGEVLDVLLAGCGIRTLQEIACSIGCKRPRDLIRRKTGENGRDGYVTRLEAVGVVERDGDTVRLRPDWLDALECEREIAGEIEAEKLQRERHDRQREAYRNPSKPDPAPSRAEMESRRRDRESLRQSDGFIEDLVRVEEPGLESPTLSPLAQVLRAYLVKNPRWRGESPSWFSTALWGENWVPDKPAHEEVAAALLELNSFVRAA